MSVDLTLPGTIPGLLRWCSPVINLDRRCIVHNSAVHNGYGRINIGADVVVLPEEVALDLTDATGRAHAAWWLAATLGMADPCATVPSLVGLDANDDRRLPDGSRWVDAEALRRVALHVAGVPQPDHSDDSAF